MNTLRETLGTPLLSLADVGVWLSLIAALAIPLYSLGLIAQIAFTYALDYSTAWYAASLVSNKVVLGQGFRVVVVQPWYFAITLPNLVFNMWSFFKSSERLTEVRLEAARLTGIRDRLAIRGSDDELECRRQVSLDRLKEATEEGRQALMPPWFSPLFALMILTLSVLVLVARDWSTATQWFTTICATGILFYVGALFARRHIPFRWALPVAFLVVYAGAAVIAAVSTGLSEPPLPAVKISTQPPRQGKLLTHADGY